MSIVPSDVRRRASEPGGDAVGGRVQAMDALRGLVMIIMALDHVREFFHADAMLFQAEDLTRTSVALFLTRWITHLCAPVFAFTAGAGAFLWSTRHDRESLSGFLWKRGLWLVLLDVVVMRLAMYFSLTTGLVILSVLWVLGWSMVTLGVISKLPLKVLAVVSLGVIVLHNLADRIQATSFGSMAWMWNLLHQPGIFTVKGVPVLLTYPLIPWFAVMAAGFCFGSVLLKSEATRRKSLVAIGLTLTVAFVGLRLLNVYGDPQPWSTQSSATMTVLSFLRTTKYPPSLSFLLMTLGPAMLIWAAFERFRWKRNNPLLIFGRVPLFYFVGHFYVIHLLTYVFAYVRYGSVEFLRSPLPSLGGPIAAYPPGFGYGLGTVYLVWLLVVSLMYVPCLYLARLKERRRSGWLSYV